MKVGILCLLLALTTTAVFAQKARTRTTKTPPATTKKTATTTETPEPKTTPKPAPVRTANVDLEAGLIFNSGDVKPVGRVTFYLLKDSAEKLIMNQQMLDAYNQDISRFGRTESLDKWSMYGAVLYMDGRLAPTFAVAAKKTLDDAAVATTTTGFDGKATFENVPVGDYYIFGYYRVGKNTTYWNLPVSVKPNNNKVILDNENMRG